MLYGSLAGALMAIAGAVTMVANSPYRPALSAEVVEVAGGVTENRVNILLLIQRGANNKLRDNRREQEGYRAKSRPVPRWLIDEQAHYENERDRLGREIRKLEN